MFCVFNSNQPFLPPANTNVRLMKESVGKLMPLLGAHHPSVLWCVWLQVLGTCCSGHGHPAVMDPTLLTALQCGCHSFHSCDKCHRKQAKRKRYLFWLTVSVHSPWLVKPRSKVTQFPQVVLWPPHAHTHCSIHMSHLQHTIR